ncbi:MAG TPA: (Fe-S)-binding protein [Candidatus Tripitaka californicus]|uniref:(Fe-S)-binding protein n=2 Tax=Candidatus Tripitaka californicus TaxID=3367616 RepID=UPI0040272D34|nr:(Fe-S)-binding protein [Planctomycetota bacterium]
MTPTREIFWNVVHHQWMYALFALSLVFFLYGLYRRYLLWSKGRPETGPLTKDLGRALWLIFSHKEILSERWPGVIHGLIFFGFLVLFIGTCLVAVQVHLHWPILYGRFYLYYSLTLDLFGGLMLLGILLASYRRYLTRHVYIKNRVDDAIILGLLFLILVTGFLMEGSRIAVLNPPWETFSPIGYLTAGVLKTLVGESGLRGLHRNLWWFHLCLAMSFIAYIPYSKLLHIFTTPLNLFLRPASPRGALIPIDFESAKGGEVFGAISPKDFTWRQLLDVDACMRCGRCDAYCPATLSQKPLRPQKIILDIRGQMERDASSPLMGGGVAGPRPTKTKIDPAEVWSCTTCLACQEACPAGIEHLQKIVDLRRGHGLMLGKYPPEIIRTIKNIETSGNPYGFSQEKREDWAEGLGIKVLRNVGARCNVPLLLWVGCAGAFDERNQRVVRAFAGFLQKAGVDFAILGREERCNGDPLRRVGNEFGFQSLARENIETLKRYNVKEIVTCCPHCLNTLRNEYPQFGGGFQVWHHTQFMERFLPHLVGVRRNVPLLTYHDPCYLGRHNGIYDAPRNLLAGATRSVTPPWGFKEMEKSRDKGFCCGGGGGHMWMELRLGQNINEMRTEQALDTGANIIATACPFCLTMLTNGVKAKNVDTVEVLDIVEIITGR